MQTPTHHRAVRADSLNAELPHKLQWLDPPTSVGDALDILGLKSELRFPNRHEHLSPSARPRSLPYQIQSTFTYLFFQDRAALKEEVETFLDRLPSGLLPDERAKLEYLHAHLLAASKIRKSRTPKVGAHSIGFVRPAAPQSGPSKSDQRLPDTPHVPIAPPSPTFSIRHAPRTTLPTSGEISLPPPGVKSGETSNNTSFWSVAPADPDSAPTSYNSSFNMDGAGDCPTQETDYPVSSPTEGLMERLYAVAGASSAIRPRVTYDTESPFLIRTTPAPVTAKKEFRSPAEDPSLYPVLPPASSEANANVTDRPAANAITPGPAQIPVEHYRIKRIPQDGISGIQLPQSFMELTMDLRLEAQRILQTRNLTPEQLDQQWTGLRNMSSLQSLAKDLGIKYQIGFETEFQNHDLVAKLRWWRSKNVDDPVFKLELLPPQAYEKSYSLQRKFGRHRFLQVDVPSLSKVPSSMELAGRPNKAAIERRVLELLASEQNLLGCKWRCFLAQPKKKKNLKDEDFKNPGAVQLTFFAVSSLCRVDQLPPMSIVNVLDYAVPLFENKHQPACKAYARLDLAASRTKPTYQFAPDDIAYDIPDITATDILSDSTFNDPDPRFNFTEPFNEKEVMSDGQAWISPWAMHRIQTKLELDHLPSVIQGRLFGAKGLWYVQSGGMVPNEKPEGPLIGISESQIKARQKLVNLGPNYDVESLTMNVVKVSQTLSPSELYVDFLPILVDRGVPRERLRQFVRHQATREAEELLSALQDRSKLRSLIHAHSFQREDSESEREIEDLAGFARWPADQAIAMLDSYFETLKNSYLCDQARKFAMTHFDQMKKEFKIQIPKSTMALGIADPYDCLEPGEIHLNFSCMFKDVETGASLPHLGGMHALVARLPALRASDMQKVNVVYKQELVHLPDVVVFSAKGKRSLASLLQGGDYDGDTFWVCWEPELVSYFRNAPAPLSLPDPETECEIQVNTHKLSHVLGLQDGVTVAPREDKVIQWVIDQVATRMRGSLLGVVTVAYGKAIYHENDLHHPMAKLLADLHDHLVDSDKRGFRFDDSALERFKKRYRIPIYSKTAYRHLLNNDDDDEDGSTAGPKPRPREENIIDCLHFFEVEKVFNKALEDIQMLVKAAPTVDLALGTLYDDTLSNYAQDFDIHAELESLSRKVAVVARTWTQLRELNQNQRTPGSAKGNQTGWDGIKLKAAEEYDAVMPDNPTHPTTAVWLTHIGSKPSTWELLKASVLAKNHHGSKLLVYSVAGYKLCDLKASHSGATRLLAQGAWFEYKPRQSKNKRAWTDDSDNEDNDSRGAGAAGAIESPRPRKAIRYIEKRQ